MDEPTQEVDVIEPETQAVTVDKGADGQPFDAARAQALIEKLREENKVARAAAKKLAELEAAEAKRKDAELSELEKANKKAAELEAELAQVKLREMRTRIGAEYKLPEALAKLLQGNDDNAMKAHAKELADALPKQATLTPTNPGNGKEGITDAQRRAFLYGGGSLP